MRTRFALGAAAVLVGSALLATAGRLSLLVAAWLVTTAGVMALARAAQVPFPAWLPGTLNAPTPTSALLHAGVVNAGAILLIRTTGVLDAAPAALWVLGGFHATATGRSGS